MHHKKYSPPTEGSASSPQKSGQSGPVRELESINGYYKKVVVDSSYPKTIQNKIAQDQTPQTKDVIMVTKRDGSQEPYNADKINQAIERAARGVSDPVGKVIQIGSETELAVFSGITTEELDQAIINTSVQNIKDDPDFDIIAKRLLLKTVYKKALGDYGNDYELEELYRKQFAPYVKLGIEQKLLDPRIGEVYDLDELSQAIDLNRDELLKYIGLTVMMKRYMIKARDQRYIETPQYFWMRVAMGLSINEKDPTQAAKQFYHKMSNLEYVPGGSTNVNAGTPHPTLSNCYLMEMHDDIGHIGKTVQDVMKLSKATGGIGLGVTKLRAEGSPIKSNNTFSSGPIPFMHTIDSTLRAVSRAGKKMGALCFYMENWHINFPEFLDLRQNAGDEYRRTRTANTSAFLSDEFMKRVKSDDDWYLFDPNEVGDLNELYGSEFSKRYKEYILSAEAGELRMFKKIKAREQFRAIIIALQTTAHPWLTWKDTINVRALNNNTGTIHLSNLCTEICLPQDKENVAVCNLASINLSKHLVNREIDYTRLERSVRLAIRQLDNLLDINKAPIAEAQHSDQQNRAVGLGIMGFTDLIERLGLSYDSEQSYELVDKVVEYVSYMAIDESAELARERGNYPNFEGSGWSKGMVPHDTIAKLEQNRGEDITVKRGAQLSMDLGSNLDWDLLREKVKGGMRNATLMAIAPTANIGLVAGTTPGIDPQFAQMFSRSTNAGKFLEINVNMVNDLKKRELWDLVKNRVIENYGDLTKIEEIPDDLKAIYKTSFGLDSKAFVEVASRAQKWIDQAMSRNMYLSTRDVEETMDVYMNAWEKGLKTTYYLHVQPRHQAEQSTTKVNKSTGIGKLGFGILNGNENNSIKQDLDQNQSNTQSIDVKKQKSIQNQSISESHHTKEPSKTGFGTVKKNTNDRLPQNLNKGFGEVIPKHTNTMDDNNTLTKDMDSTKVDESMNAKSSFVTPPKPSSLEPESDNNVMVSGKGFKDVSQTSNTSVNASATNSRSIQSPPNPSNTTTTSKKHVSSDACPVDPQDRLNCDSCQ